ncbi:hypothetical protein EJ02DRAFT_457123 [Clathrospora elynae]|uniref:Uncharacterized protein n=1 Tax=Clathrospora elynae TaxID=706981 RepID=A0A6A5SHV6_9PLEO|nr:hypothetical protein EJ02DRAFT_457123 [Clathrospora elynae]
MFRPFKNTTAAHTRPKPFAAALSRRSTGVGKGKAKAKRAPLRLSPAAPPATPSPKPPACLSLLPLSSALAGRSSGECFDQSGGGSRCFRCASGHSSALAAPIAAKFLAALQGGAPESQLRKLRIALRVVLKASAEELGSSEEEGEDEEVEEEQVEEEEEEEERVEEEDASELPQGLLERRKRIKELLGELVDLIVI